MSRRSLDIDDIVHEYVIAHTAAEHPAQTALRAATARHPHAGMQISVEQAQLMQLLAKLIGARRAIEIGVFTGYSALSVALALPPNGLLLACDISDDYTRVGQGPCPAGTCTIVDAKPKNRYSSYTLVKVFYDSDHRISKADYFGSRPDKPRKTLELTGYVRQGRSWQPSRSVMTNHETETSTQIVWSGYQIDTPIDERIMTPSSIGR